MTPTLIVLVPLLVVPVVALLAFAGCAPFGEAPAEPTDPKKPDTPDDPKIPKPGAVPPYRKAILEAPGEGLVAYWSLGDVNTTVLADLGPNQLDGTYTTAPAPTQGKAGGALSRQVTDVCTGFSGDQGLAKVDFQPLLNPSSGLKFSMEIWVRLRNPAARAGDSETLASGRGKDADGDTGWELYVSYGNNGEPTFKARVHHGNDNTSATVQAAPAGVADDAWRLVVLTYDGAGAGTVSIHVHIVGTTTAFTESKTPAPFTSTTDGTSPLVFGAFNANAPQRLFQGDLDEAAFYNRALSAAQVKAHFGAAG